MSHIEDEETSHKRRSGSNEDKLGTRRTWTAREEEFLVNALKLLASSGWKYDDGFRNGSLIQLEKCMICAFPNCGIKAEPHISSNIDIWKKQYSFLVGMMSKSVFGRDESTCMITIEDNYVWEGYLKIYPTAKKMRYKSWPYFSAWCQIFGKDRAIGKHAEDVHQAAAAVQEEEQADMQDRYIPTTSWNPKTRFDGVVKELPMTNTTKRTSTTSKKRKADEIVAALPKLVEVVTNFCASANNAISKLTRVLENEFGDPVKRGLVLEAVKQLTVFDENEQLLAARHLYNQPKDVELFFTLSTESRIKMVRLMLAGRF
ncbi:UNVERIFIED_CONTAM: hypothetical protein Slati_2955400 [Sesamum latifolium]|uniref:Myb/SANT-like domain-containing protein n=1 Tax=Sesamum latifolium TaxID=2727402 RepID=A0AAW2VEU5_9LAMI